MILEVISSVALSAVYLRSSPDVCFRRLQERGRQEEKPVTIVSEDTDWDGGHNCTGEIPLYLLSLCSLVPTYMYDL